MTKSPSSKKLSEYLGYAGIARLGQARYFALRALHHLREASRNLSRAKFLLYDFGGITVQRDYFDTARDLVEAATEHALNISRSANRRRMEMRRQLRRKLDDEG